VVKPEDNVKWFTFELEPIAIECSCRYRELEIVKMIKMVRVLKFGFGRD
jgi:hypothetical protein